MKLLLTIGLIPTLASASWGQHADAVQWETQDGGNGHWYQAVLVPCDIVWDDASAAAQAMPGDWYLATVHSAEENAFIYQLVDESAYWNTSLVHAAGPWLGGYASCFTCGDWRWVTDEPWSYTNWGPSEPFHNGDRLGLFGYHASMGDEWNDIQDGYLVYGYVVETDSTPLGMAQVYGSSINLPGSMTIQSGSAALGTTLTLALHDPGATMGTPSLTSIFFSTDPDPHYPCAGTMLPRFGLAAPGAQAELLIGLAGFNPFLRLVGPPWSGTPSQIAVPLPSSTSLLGLTFYGQGMLIDPSGRIGLTNAVELRLGL